MGSVSPLTGSIAAERWRPEWSVPHRLLQKRSFTKHQRNGVEAHHEWLVKWCGLGYEHATWESYTAPFLNSTQAQSLIDDYKNRHSRAKRSLRAEEEHEKEYIPHLPADSSDFLSLLEGSSNYTDGDIVTLKKKLGKFVPYPCTEYWVPVQISDIQLEQYCYTLVSNSLSLRSNATTVLKETLSNTLMSLKKCCDHPYVLDLAAQGLINKDLKDTEYLESRIKATGKLQLLDAMLLEIKNRGLKAVVFFQSTGDAREATGDILDDFVREKFGPESYERIEYSIVPSREISAIDRFNQESGRFVLLLGRHACKTSIKLESVDAFIIFNSNWSPAYDLKVLQKIKLKSKFENTKVFRLYSACTVEEKILILAKQSKLVVRNPKNLNWSTTENMLMWGASNLFSKLDEFHHTTASIPSVSSDLSHLNDVLCEFKTILSGNSSATKKLCLVIKTKHNQGSYSTKNLLFGERHVELMDGLSPQIFWANVMEGKAPKWKYIANSSARIRKRVQHLDDPLNICLAKKRKKVVGDSDNLPPCGDGSDNVMVHTKEIGFVIPRGQTNNENAALDTMVSGGAMVDGVNGDANKKLVLTNDAAVEDDLVRVMSDGVAGWDVLGVVASGSTSSQGNALQASCSSQLQMLNEVSKPSGETLTASGTAKLTEAAENTMASPSFFSKDNISNGSKSFVPDSHAAYDDVIPEMHEIEAGSPVPPLPSNPNPPRDGFPTAMECKPQSSNRDLFTYQIAGTFTQQVEPVVPPPASIAGHAPADPLFSEMGTTVSDARIAGTSPLYNNPNLQTASQTPLSLYTNPFEYEMERILKELDQTAKTHIEFNEVLTSEYQKEMDQVHMKYATKRKEEETNFQLKKKELHARYNKVHMHKTLVADAFKSLSEINQK